MSKKIILISSPLTSFEVEIQKIVYCPDGEVYFLPEGIEFHKTEEQSQKRIEELELICSELRQKLDQILDIVYPERYDEEK